MSKGTQLKTLGATCYAILSQERCRKALHCVSGALYNQFSNACSASKACITEVKKFPAYVFLLTIASLGKLCSVLKNQ